MRHLVLSLFPGADLFGEAFEREGFCVVRGPELILGQDIRTWSAIEGKFDVVIGGPPCPFFSTATRGNIPLQGNLIPEFERVIVEAKPRVFAMENVPQAPVPHVDGYAIKDFVLNAHHYGANQNRKRRFSFGYRHDGSLNSWPFHLEDSLPVHLRTPDPFPTVMACEHKYPGGLVVLYVCSIAFGIIRRIFVPAESEILRGALGAKQFILRSSCRLSKSILSTNTTFSFSYQFLNMACRSQVTGIEEMERVRGFHEFECKWR